MRGAVRNKKRWKGRRTPTQDPSTKYACVDADAILHVNPSLTTKGLAGSYTHTALRSALALISARCLPARAIGPKSIRPPFCFRCLRIRFDQLTPFVCRPALRPLCRAVPALQ